MPAVVSPDISFLDFSVLFDISTATPSITLTNASTGPDLASCTWWYEITTPSGTYIHQGTELSPDMTGVWTTQIVPDTWPQPFNQIEWSGSDYKVVLYVKDGAGNIFFTSHQGSICRPNGNTSKSIGNFGLASVDVNVKCDNAQVYAGDTTNYLYKTTNGESVSSKMTLVYPADENGNVPAPVTLNDTSSALFTIYSSGKGYSLYSEGVRDYEIGDNVTVRIKYKVSQSFAVWCNIDLCPLICEIDQMNQEWANNCGQAQDPSIYQKITRINSLLIKALIAKQQPLCGFDLAEIVEEIMEVGGFTCSTCAVGSAGINPSNPLGNINVSLSTACGLSGSANVVGSNILLSLSGSQYAVALTQDMIDAGFSVASTTVGCVTTYTIDFTGAGACPVVAPIYTHGTSTPPSDCPNPVYPLDVWNVTDAAIIGTANSITDLVAILNGDTGVGGWFTLYGIAVVTGGCQVAFPCGSGTPAVHVSVSANPPCVDQTKVFEKNIQDYNSPGTIVPILTFPRNYYVSYTIGGTKVALGNIASYSDLLTALNAEASKPSNVTYLTGTVTPPAAPFTVKVSVFDVDCDQIDQIDIWSDEPTTPSTEGLMVVGDNSDKTTAANRKAGVYDILAMAPLGKLCGMTADRIPWHVFKWNNFLFTVETDTGKVYKFDMSNPKSPNLVATLNLPIPVLPSGGVALQFPTAFSGVPTFGGTPSHRDVYFVTDYTDGGNVTYIMESASGVIWQLDLAAFTVTHYLQNQLYLGRKASCVINGTVYMTFDGNRPTTTGQIILNQGAIQTTKYATGPMSWATYSLPDLTDYAWAMSYDSSTGYLWVTTYKGALLRGTVSGDSLVDLGGGNYWVNYPGTFNVSNARSMASSVIHNNILYVSWRRFGGGNGPGTQYVDLASPGSGATQMPIIGSAYDHCSFYPVPGKNYGILSSPSDDTVPGSLGQLIKCDFTGNGLGTIAQADQLIYNVIAFTLPGGNTPNTYC